MTSEKISVELNFDQLVLIRSSLSFAALNNRAFSPLTRKNLLRLEKIFFKIIESLEKEG